MDKLEIINILKEMNIVDSYVSFSQKHQYPVNEWFEKYDNQEVLDIIKSLGYDAKYMKSENFFKVLYPVYKDAKFQLNLGLKYGIVEIIFSVRWNDQVLTGSPMSYLIKKISEQEMETIKPQFKNYEELEVILKWVFTMFDDFRNRVIATIDRKYIC